MRGGRCRFTQPILIRTERGLRDAAAEIARRDGTSLSEIVRVHLRDLVARDARAATATAARP